MTINSKIAPAEVGGYAFVEAGMDDDPIDLKFRVVQYSDDPYYRYKEGFWINGTEKRGAQVYANMSGIISLEAAEEFAIRILYAVKQARGEI